jgi:superfamily II DNA/RNA helicase
MESKVWRELLVLAPTREHIVQFYESHPFLCEAVSLFIGSGLAKGEAVVVIATPELRTACREQLGLLETDLAECE